MNEKKKNYKTIIDFINFRISELDNIKGPDHLNSIRRYIELNLKTDLREIPELIYIYKYREITGNFEVDVQNEINTLILINNLLKKIDAKTETSQKVIKLKEELINLLKESDIFNNSKIDDDNFSFWESKIKKLLDNYEFTIDIKSDFNRNIGIKYKDFNFYEGSNHLETVVPFLQDRINHQRKLILRILKNLIELGKEIFTEIKRTNFQCFLVNSPECERKIIEKDNQVFIAYDYKDEKMKSIINFIIPILKAHNLNPITAKDKIVNYDFMCKICGLIQESKYILAEISNHNLNVGLELGLAIGLQKKTMLIANKNSKEIGDLKRTDSVRYGENLEELKNDLGKMLKNILE
jgi:hypothetical protein